jgi:competence protein ComEA
VPDPQAPARSAAPDEDLFDRWHALRRDPRVVVAVLCAVAVAAFVVWSRASSGSPPPTSPDVTAVSAPGVSSTTSAPRVLVHVVGAVRTPGVVELDTAARVRDALAAAGGPADDADVEQLNLAAPVGDGQRLVVPRVGEPAPVTPAGVDEAAGTPPGPLDLNLATITDLETLPGIGPTLAEAIVRHREKHGRFRSVEDLKQVRGIGEGRFADIRDLVRV